jgi:hypothetical protein
VEKILKLLVGLISLVMTIAWLRIMIAPMGLAERLAMNPDVPLGLNSIRSFIGAYVLCAAVFSFLALRKAERQWLLVPLCLFVGSAIGRTTGLVIDGFHPTIVGSIILEIVLMAVTIAAYRKFPSVEVR